MPHKEHKKEDGSKLPSVTELLGTIHDPTLLEFYGNLGIEKAERIRDYLADYGRKVHSAIEAKIGSGTYDGATDKVLLSAKAAVKWLKVVDGETKEQERNITSEELGFGGTFDWRGVISPQHCILDWKNSTKIKLINRCQLAAYARLWNWENKLSWEDGINAGVIARIDRKTFEVEAEFYEPLSQYYPVVEACLTIWRFLHDHGFYREPYKIDISDFTP